MNKYFVRSMRAEISEYVDWQVHQHVIADKTAVGTYNATKIKLKCSGRVVYCFYRTYLITDIEHQLLISETWNHYFYGLIFIGRIIEFILIQE